ncbi:pyridoxamine 5'-phosphate oxidase family protein [Actinocorallia libanotica]|uniref:pyridoxamine 5'-phosphate oxidase family protein n=1 Tax=Actinocorallia libanotica TaxID=46162 RepID=UPI0031D4777A
MEVDAHGLEVLDQRECLRLLASVPVGRVAFTERALPAIQPVNFVLDGTDVILRTNVGSKLGLAIRRAVVAFEADDFDTERGSGWSVTLLGEARAVTDPAEAERLSRLPLPAWAPGPRDRYIRISGRYVSGRRINAVAA